MKMYVTLKHCFVFFPFIKAEFWEGGVTLSDTCLWAVLPSLCANCECAVLLIITSV